MSMQLVQKEVSIGKSKLLVTEADWNYSYRFSDADKSVESIVADPATDEVFKFFCQNYYPLMVSCVIGECPTAEEAYELSGKYLDDWYKTVWELNPDIILKPYRHDIDLETVEFRDGSKLTILEMEGLPSATLKLIQLENEAINHPLENDPAGQMFISLFYPKMVASCNGSKDIPDALTVRDWPRSEIEKWLSASRRLNPGWFMVSEEDKTEVVKVNKKKARKRSGG